MSAARTSTVPALLALASVLSSTSAHAADFSYDPAGDLVAGSGKGRVDPKVYAPDMRFPIEKSPAYANSQVWGRGGNEGGGGSQCDAENFSYPWHDNYCESRTYDMPMCPAGQGHQGQDIRAASCKAGVHWAVAAEDGTVTNIGSYSVYVTAADGTRYDYLHMSDLQVAEADKVKKGQRIGKVSNVFNGTPTTVHLHFNIRQNVQGVGTVYAPTYMSLVQSYEELLASEAPDAGPPAPPPAPPPTAAAAPLAEDENDGRRLPPSDDSGCAVATAITLHGRSSSGVAMLAIALAFVRRRRSTRSRLV